MLVAMRRFLLGFLMLAMFTPALACGVMMCANPARAASDEAVRDMPCHDEQQDKDKQPGLMFFKDCLKVELAQADGGDTIKKPDIKVAKIFYGPATLIAGYSFDLVDSYQIRGPPIEAAQSRTRLPLYLATQRLRI